MNVQEQLEELDKFLKKLNNNVLARECANEIENHEVLFLPPVKFNTKETYDIYKTRIGLQKRVFNRELGTEYKAFLKNLSEHNESEIYFYRVSISRGVYIIFTSISKDKLIGIFMALQGNIDTDKELHEYYRKTGVAISSERFIKMKSVFEEIK